MATVRGRLAGNGGSTAGTTIIPSVSTGWTGAAPLTGDIVLIVGLGTGISSGTWSQTAGTGTWTFQSTGDGNSGASLVSFAAWRIFDGTETDPTFTFGTSGTRAWALIALTPSAGTIAIDVWSAVNVVTALGNTFTPNAATVTAGTDVASIILTAARAGANLSAAITPTPPSGWIGTTSGADYSGFAGGATTRANLASTSNQVASLTGSVAPGSETLSSAQTLAATMYHVLLLETSGAGPPALQQPGGKVWRHRYRRHQMQPAAPLGVTIVQISDSDASAAAVDAQSIVASLSDSDASATAIDSQSIVASLSSADTGSGLEASTIAVALSSADTGTGVDAQVSIRVTDSDAGSGIDAGAAPAATLSSADTGTGADAQVRIAVTSADASGAAAEASSIAAALSSADTGTGTDAAVSIAVLSTDAGAGAESSSVAAALSSADTGSGIDAQVSIRVSSADTGTGADGGESIAATLSSGDTGTGTDAVVRIAVSSADASNAAAEASSVVLGANDSDTGHGTDGGESILASLSSADTGTGIDAAVTIAVASADASGAAAEASSIAAALSSADTGTGADAQVSIRVTDSDTGAGLEASTITASLSSTDTGSAVDRGARLTDSDTGVAAEASTILASLSDFDTWHDAEAGTSPGSGTQISDSDSGRYQESEIDYLSAGDTGTAADAAAAFQPFSADTGHGTEAQAVAITGTVSVADSDTGKAAEAGVVTGTGTVTVSDSDTGHGTEASPNTFPASDADTGTSLETLPTLHNNTPLSGIRVWATIPDYQFLHGGGGPGVYNVVWHLGQPDEVVLARDVPEHLGWAWEKMLGQIDTLTLASDSDGGLAGEAAGPLATVVTAILAPSITIAVEEAEPQAATFAVSDIGVVPPHIEVAIISTGTFAIGGGDTGTGT